MVLAPRRETAVGVAWGALLCAFIAMFFTHAWVVDDAFITFRTIDNFVNGFGLRWNIDERVQAYTHPLWMFVCSAVYAFTHEVFYSVLALSLVVSLLAVIVTGRALGKQAGASAKVVMLALLLCSKAFMDFSSSGLENPLSHLLIGAFFVRFLFPREPWQSAPGSQAFLLYVLAALGFVNRQDTLVLFAPACALVALQQLRTLRLAALPPLLLSALPALGWVAFSLLYYGSAVPNTAYAKLMATGVTGAERVQAGLTYFATNVQLDPTTLPLSLLALLLCFWHALRTRTWPFLCAAAGLAGYNLYVLLDGAIGTHMSGRFSSAPAMLSALLIAALVRQTRGRALLLTLSAAALLLAPRSPLRVTTVFYDHTRPPGSYVIDTRDYAQYEGTSLLDAAGHLRAPEHPAYRAGLAFRASPLRVHVGAPGKAFIAMVGFSGYAAGPQKYIIDVLGLTDPLLARLPIAKRARYRPGHFFRVPPVGYVISVEQRRNLIADADLHAFYDALLQVTRGPLWSKERLLTIWRLQTGAYDHYVRAYAARRGLRTL